MRTCNTEGCTLEAEYVAGHYMVGPRTVRLWVCRDHYMMIDNPLEEVDPPHSIQAMLEAERKVFEKAERIDRSRVIDLDARSVHSFQPAGTGKPIAFDRVRAFRWGA